MYHFLPGLSETFVFFNGGKLVIQQQLCTEAEMIVCKVVHIWGKPCV